MTKAMVIPGKQVHLRGILVSSEGLRTTATGKLVCRFVVREHGMEYQCVSADWEAKQVALISEGSEIQVTGRIQTRCSEDPRTGQEWETHEVIVWTVSAPSCSG
jgi:hypothetical protein